MWQLRENLKAGTVLKWYRDMLADAGHNFALRILLWREIVTAEPRNVEAILSTQQAEFSLKFRERDFKSFFGSGIFSQEGPAWKHSRDMLKSQFRQKRTATLELITPHTEELIQCIEPGERVDIFDLFHRYTLDATTILFFGKSADALADRHRSGLEDLDDFTTALAASFQYKVESELWLRIRGSRYSKGRHAKRTCFQLMDSMVANARKERERRANGEETDFYAPYIEELLDSFLSDEDIRSQMLHTTVAGRDSTAALLSWTWYVGYFLPA